MFQKPALAKSLPVGAECGPEVRRNVLPKVKLRLLTLNIHKGFTVFNRRFILPELREAIRSVGADVVCLQEVLGEHSGHQARYPSWPSLSQYEFLADSIWHQHAYGRNAVYTQGHHGNAVLSKHGIGRYQNHDISISGREQRGLLHCVLDLPNGRALHLITVHLSLTEGHRQQQLARLSRFVAEQLPSTAALIVAGDFNDWRSRAHSVLAAACQLDEVYVGSTGRAALSYPARFPLLRLDRIYVRNVASARPIPLTRRPWSHLSDHVPLAAEITL